MHFKKNLTSAVLTKTKIACSPAIFLHIFKFAVTGLTPARVFMFWTLGYRYSIVLAVSWKNCGIILN
jgi:hypothetical protein